MTNKLVAVVVVPAVVQLPVPVGLRWTVYPVAPADAVHETVIDVVEVTRAAKFAGVDGGMPGAVTVTETGEPL